jgi:uncharacterized protein with NRDE domain
VVAANRDEFFSRRTAAADFWDDAPDVLAGRDLEAGGTWLGVSRSGRFAALTNFRDPARNKTGAPSRGELVSRFLTGLKSHEAYLAELESCADCYNGFNLVFGDPDGLWCFSNCGEGERQLASGVYGLSNHLLDTPWPKVARGKSALNAALRALPEKRHFLPQTTALRLTRPARRRRLDRNGCCCLCLRAKLRAFSNHSLGMPEMCVSSNRFPAGCHPSERDSSPLQAAIR